MKKILTLVLLTAMILTGCAQGQTPISHDPVTITHELGELTVNQNPEKVVIFDMGILDTFQALELPVSGLPKSNIPSQLNAFSADTYFDAGTLFEPNYEEIYNQKPDLIIISGRASSAYEQLNEIAPTLYLTTNNDAFLDSVLDNLEILSNIFTSKKSVIENAATDLKKDVSELKEKVQGIDDSALFLLANGDAMSVYGPKSRFGFVYDDFGFKPKDSNIESSTHGQSVSFEYLAATNPEILFVMDRGQIVGGVQSAQDLLNNTLVNSTSAAKNGKIIYVDPEVWYLTTGGLNATRTMIQEVSVLFNK